MGDYPGELVGPDRGHLRDRWARDQPRRRPLRGSRGPPSRPGLPADVRPRSHRAELQTRKSNLYFAQSARTNVFRADEPVDVRRSLFQTEDYIQQVLSCDALACEPVRVEKMVAFYTSRDGAISEPLGSAGESASRYPGFAEALERHKRAWDELWRACDIKLPGNDRVLKECGPLPAPDPAEPGGRARTSHVPWRADRCDSRSGGRSPLARSVT